MQFFLLRMWCTKFSAHLIYKNTKFQTFSIDVQSSDPVQVKDPYTGLSGPIGSEQFTDE